jgi:hypothetical protein
MSEINQRKIALFWLLCIAAMMLELTCIYSRAEGNANAYDVMLSGRDIGIIAAILVSFMGSVAGIIIAFLRTIGRLAKSIDSLKDTIVSGNFTNAQSIHTLVETIGRKPCFAEDLVKDSLKEQLHGAIHLHQRKEDNG